MPFIIVAVVILHIWALHQFGSNNPLGIDAKGPQDKIPFHPYYTIKDTFGLGVFLIAFAAVIFYAPNYMGHPDNRSEEHTSELQSLMRISYAVFCLKNKKSNILIHPTLLLYQELI